MKNRGATFIPVIVFVVLWLLTMTIFFVLYGNWQKLEQEIGQNNRLKERISTRIEKPITNKLDEVQSLVGFYEENGSDVDITTVIKNLNKLNSNDKSRGSRKEYGLESIASPEIISEKLTSLDYPLNLESVLNSFEIRIMELQQEEARLNRAIEQVKRDRDNRQEEYRQIKETQAQILSALNERQEKLENKYSAYLQHVNDQKNRDEEEKARLEEKRKALEARLKAQGVEFENAVQKKLTRIREIQAAKYGNTTYSEINEARVFVAGEEKHDGEIVFGDPASKTVYVNLGVSNKVLKGMRFDVYRRSTGGKKDFKGRIEIQRVMEKMSATIILEQLSNLDPIVAGDLIINPLFNESQPVYLVFAGNMSKINNQRAIQLAKEAGAIVENSISARTNFVIVSDQKGEEHKNYTDAVKFKIPLMPEKTFLKYIGD